VTVLLHGVGDVKGTAKGRGQRAKGGQRLKGEGCRPVVTG
jgi:hypothetical protein